MRLRHFYKVNHKKEPIPGSNIKRKSKPSPLSQWKEILDLCCEPSEIDCTCGPRYFVKLDTNGKPVPGSLIKRYVYPKMETGMKYQEINWRSVCCPSGIPFNYAINFLFDTEDASATILLNGDPVDTVSGGVPKTGTFFVQPGDTVHISIVSEGNCSSYSLTWPEDSASNSLFGDLEEDFEIIETEGPYDLVIDLYNGTCGE